MTRDIVSVERVIPAPAEKVFALLADPSRHPEIDGSGTVRGLKQLPTHVGLGSEFGMKMHYHVGYSMKSRVIEYDENRRIAWQTIPSYPFTDRIAGGRIWRYELEPVEGGTLVRESWDISREHRLTKPLIVRLRDETRENMTRTLERIEEVLCSS